MRILPTLIASAICLATISTVVQAETHRRTVRKPPTAQTVKKDSVEKEDNVAATPPTKPPTTTPPTTTPPTVPPVVPATTKLSAEGEGRRAYLRFNCYGCHGMGATGGMGPNIVHAEAGDVSEAVMQGEDEGMPSYRRIATATDVSNLAAYLRSIGTAREPKFNDWWVANPTK